MKISIANPSVAPHVKQNVTAYFENGHLTTFYTTFFSHPVNKLSILLSKIPGLKKEIKKRSFNNIPIAYFESKPLPEIVRSISARKLNTKITDAIWHYAELSFDRWVARKIDVKKIDIIHTYEHCALATLKKAKEHGIYTIYEQLSQHHTFFTSIAHQQFSSYPDLKNEDTSILVNGKAMQRNKRRDEELRLADTILCNSSFTKKTLILAGIKEEKITVIPLAFPIPIDRIRNRNNNEPIKFLYAGNQSLRKGSHILYEAWKICDFKAVEAELWLVGKMQLPEQLRMNLPGKVVIKNTIPHDELLALYSEADIFVLPTLADGFGMVITESMSQGTPVITTENSAGPDIIEHDKNGWIIPAGDLNALIGQMKAIVNDGVELDKISAAALLSAHRWQWPDYRYLLNQKVNALYKVNRKKL
ncbi:glycosyltransferase family 4 protein [Pedobacter sp. R20-19]|uniref:glycosyltransferase family 4 protein n=1 Tax=Pedobacter sp. R20-19 TaxID=1270196 RepID=UPI000493A5A8|nr:glycosyltransferase family 4 protein [Pedobacter sp. R20-19]